MYILFKCVPFPLHSTEVNWLLYFIYNMHINLYLYVCSYKCSISTLFHMLLVHIARFIRESVILFCLIIILYGWWVFQCHFVSNQKVSKVLTDIHTYIYVNMFSYMYVCAHLSIVTKRNIIRSLFFHLFWPYLVNKRFRLSSMANSTGNREHLAFDNKCNFQFSVWQRAKNLNIVLSRPTCHACIDFSYQQTMSGNFWCFQKVFNTAQNLARLPASRCPLFGSD